MPSGQFGSVAQRPFAIGIVNADGTIQSQAGQWTISNESVGQKRIHLPEGARYIPQVTLIGLGIVVGGCSAIPDVGGDHRLIDVFTWVNGNGGNIASGLVASDGTVIVSNGTWTPVHDALGVYHIVFPDALFVTGNDIFIVSPESTPTETPTPGNIANFNVVSDTTIQILMTDDTGAPADVAFSFLVTHGGNAATGGNVLTSLPFSLTVWALTPVS